ncbi:MAG: epoxide hydrolase [Roseibium sp.]|uniref:epoxide hydrolase family protein n=1 Tax=Roseibium sp. TaxID=1936156 RepID=UPI003D9C166B
MPPINSNTSLSLTRRNFLKMSGAGFAALGAMRPSRLMGAIPAADRFVIDVPQATLDRIRQRVADAVLADPIPGETNAMGPTAAYMQDLRTHWLNAYDWRATERRINRFDHYRAEIEGEALHYIVEEGSGPNPRRLLLLHGWPHNFISFLDIIEPLAHPERFGGRVEDAFTVVVPSFPGTGFSDKPATPLGPKAIGVRLHTLMTEVLGFDRYMMQGGDWGALVASWMAVGAPNEVEAIHLNHLLLRPEGAWLGSGQLGKIPDPSEEERAFVAAEAAAFASPTASYFPMQSARPQSIAHALADSPMGSAAWYADKFLQWVDTSQRTATDIIDHDTLLDQVMVNLVTGTDDTALWIYHGAALEMPWTLPERVKVEVPTGFAAFPDPFIAPPPRSLAERSYNVTWWREETEGGHWPMIERADLFVDSLRQFARTL